MTRGLQGIYLFYRLSIFTMSMAGDKPAEPLEGGSLCHGGQLPGGAAVTLQLRVPLPQDSCPSLFLGSDLGQKYSFIHTFSIFIHINIQSWVVPGGLVVKNPSADAGDTGSLRGLGMKIPPAVGQLNSSHDREPSCRTSEAPRPQASCSAT